MRVYFSSLLFLVFFGHLMAQAPAEKLSWADSTSSFLSNVDSYSNDRGKWLCDSVISIYQRQGKVCEALNIRIIRATCNKNLAAYDKALEEALYVVENKPEDCDSMAIKGAFVLIAKVFYDLHDAAKTDSASLFAMKHIDENDGDLYIDMLVIRGIGLWMNGILNTSFNYFKEAIQAARSPSKLIKANTALAISYSILYLDAPEKNATAEAYRDSALVLFENSLEVAYAKDLKKFVPGIYNAMAGLMSDRDLQRQYVDSAILMARSDGTLTDLLFYLRNKALRFRDESYDILLEYTELQDSLYSLNRLQAISEVEERYQSKLKSEENRRLNSELRLREQSLAKSRTITSLVSGGGLIILIALGLLFGSHRRVQKERKASDELLLNILPSETARELKEKGFTTAHRFEKATVIFTDIKDFTRLSEAMSAEELVQEIDRYFREFDEIVYQHKLEKIKSIGDAYICAAGLPENSTSSAYDAVKAALALQAKANEIKKKRQAKGEPFFEFRCGIHTGPVVAGVVGIKKWQYDIWGDTVNLAARMEQASDAGKINISQVTYEKVSTQFRCIPRGKIYAKNKGQVEMYFVEEEIT